MNVSLGAWPQVEVRGIGGLVLCSPRLQALDSRILEDKTFTRDPKALRPCGLCSVP